MMESLVHELTKVGLQLSSAKTKIFTTQALTKPLFVEVGGEMVEVLMCDQTHKYLGTTPLRFISSGDTWLSLIIASNWHGTNSIDIAVFWSTSMCPSNFA